MGKTYNTKSDNNIYKQLRKKLKMSQNEVGKQLNLVPSTISKWETGVAIPDQAILPTLATLYGVTVDYLLGMEDASIYSIPNIEQLPETELIPLLGTIACGKPILADENIEEYLTADVHFKATFALRCKGDSMIGARIFDGDIVYIRQQNDVENGEIAAVLIDGEATLKRVYKYENRLVLKAENQMFANMYFEYEELATITILGRAVAFTSIVR